MDFTKGLIQNRTYFVEYYMGEFYIRYGDERIPIANTDDIRDVMTLYCLPSNSVNPPWTQKDLNAPIRPDNYAVVLKFWAKYRPGLEISGKIIDGMFYEDTQSNEA